MKRRRLKLIIPTISSLYKAFSVILLLFKMKVSSFLLSLLPLTAAATSIPQPRAVSAPEPATSAECCPFTYKPTCTKNLERVFHIKLFYNRKEGITPEQFNAYWANNHTKTAGDFHLRFGVYKYSQVSNPKLKLVT
jgi:hypothetical protein